MAFFEVTLRSETALALRDIALFFQEQQSETPQFHLSFQMETATILLFSAEATFSIADAFTRVQSDRPLIFSVDYTLSAMQLEKLQPILGSSPVYPLILQAYPLKINFKRQVEHTEQKQQFFTFLTLDFPVVETFEGSGREELYERVFKTQKVKNEACDGDFNDISTLASLDTAQVLLFPTRFQQAEQLFRVLQLDRNVVLSVQISDYVDFNELRPQIKARTENINNFMHPGKIAGSIRTAWLTDDRDCWLLNKIQMHTARTLQPALADKKQAVKATHKAQKVIESAPFAALALQIGRQPIIQQFCAIENGATLGLAFLPETSDLNSKLSDPEPLKFVAPNGVLFLERRFCNCTGILRVPGIRGEICYFCRAEDVPSTLASTYNAPEGLSPQQMQHLQLTPNQLASPGPIELPQHGDLQQSSPLQRARFSEFKSQDLKFAMKFSAGQNVQFPIYNTHGSPQQHSALDLSGLRPTEENISSIHKQQDTSGRHDDVSIGRKSTADDADILSLLNDDSGIEW